MRGSDAKQFLVPEGEDERERGGSVRGRAYPHICTRFQTRRRWRRTPIRWRRTPIRCRRKAIGNVLVDMS